MNTSYTFFLNGKKYKVSKNIIVSDLVDSFGYTKLFLLIEYNNFICTITHGVKFVLAKIIKLKLLLLLVVGNIINSMQLFTNNCIEFIF